MQENNFMDAQITRNANIYKVLQNKNRYSNYGDYLLKNLKDLTHSYQVTF